MSEDKYFVTDDDGMGREFYFRMRRVEEAMELSLIHI